MKTKALLLATALGASLAYGQGVVSQNIVGYINIDAPNGLSMIANQLDNKAGNKVGDLIPTAPDGTTLYKFAAGAFALNTYVGAWDDANQSLNPGEGAFISNGSGAPIKLTFVGEVRLGSTTTAIPAGLSIISSQVPVEVKVGDLAANGLTPGDGDVVYRFANGGFSLNTFVGGWDDPASTIKVGESVFYNNAGAAKSWTRTFTVN